MKEFIFILWMLITFLLVLSIIGMVLFIPKDTYTNCENTPSTWNAIGRSLLSEIIRKK